MAADIPLPRRCRAEALGTFVLVFAGTGAIIFNDLTAGTVGHVGIALTFGLTVCAMIHTVGEVSGAHLNPAVTLGFWAAGRFPRTNVPAYLAAQCGGALLASGLLWFLFPAASTLGATHPWGESAPSVEQMKQAFVLEVWLTAVLMLTILAVSHGAKEKGLTAGIVIGGVVALEALFAGPICGASMNPARSLAPALCSGEWHDLWIYLLAPIAGALVAVPCCQSIHGRECCEGSHACRAA